MNAIHRRASEILKLNHTLVDATHRDAVVQHAHGAADAVFVSPNGLLHGVLRFSLGGATLSLQAIDSVLGQTMSDLELIVVDDRR